MRLTRSLKRLTNLTILILALACGAAAQAGQADARGAQPPASAASLLATLKAVESDPSPKAARARWKAVDGLKRLGTAAIPALTEFLNTEKKGPARVQVAAALAGIDPKNALARQTLTAIVREGKDDELIEAAVVLADLDLENEVAVPKLAKMASKTVWIPSGKNMSRLRGAAFALALTAPGVRALTPLLAHWDSWVRQSAVYAFDDRTETLSHASPSVRAAVKDAIPTLVKALADKDEIVRGMTTEVLEQLGADAVPELKKAAASDDKKLAPAAAELLKQMNKGSSTAPRTTSR
jgi:HEAT repeat protein